MLSYFVTFSEEMEQESISARTQALLLFAALLADRSASDSVWAHLIDRQFTMLFSLLLQCLENDETGT